MRLITWNLAGRVSRALDQVDAMRELDPDLIALQEVTKSSVSLLSDALRVAGFHYVVDSFEHAGSSSELSGPRKYGLIIASREPLSRQSALHTVPWPERYLTVLFDMGGANVELATTHIPPGSSNGWMKVDMLEAVFRNVARDVHRPKILCGDFNTPQFELPNAAVVTWAERLYPPNDVRARGRIRGRDGERWRLAEHAILLGLREFGIRDIFRALHGYELQEYSIELRRGSRAVRRRFDHIFASASLAATRCLYRHEFRIAGLSDHTPMVADFARPALDHTATCRRKR